MRRINEVVACFAQLSTGAERLLDERNTLRDRCQQADLQVQEARSELSILRRQSVGLASATPSNNNNSVPQTTTPASTVDVKKMAEMEAKFASLKDERSELYKAQSQNTLKLLELSDQLKQREARIVELMRELEAGKAEQQRYNQRLEDFENLVREKNFTIQILQDELTALQLELIKMDDEESTGTMLRRVSIGGIPINSTNTPEVFVERIDDNIPKGLERINIPIPDNQITCADGEADGRLVFGSGNHLACRDADGTDWTVKLNARVCQVSTRLSTSKGIILCGRRDGIVSLINTESHRIRAQLVSPDVRELTAMAVSVDGEHIWTLSPNCLKYWHCDRSICLRTINIADGRCLCVQGDSVFVGMAGGGGGIQRLSMDTMSDLKPVFQHTQPAVSLEAASAKHGELIAAAFTDKVVLLQRDRPVQTFTAPTAITKAGFFKDTHLYVAHGNKVTFYGLSGFSSERQICLPVDDDGDDEHVLQVLPDELLLISSRSIYKLSH